MVHVGKYDYKGHRITIGYDEKSPNPRTRHNTIGKLLYLVNSHYSLGDEETTEKKVEKIMNNTNNICLPVFAFIHNETPLSTK